MERLTFYCNSCERDRDFDTEYGLLVANHEKKTIFRMCKQCRRPKAGVPDVYWDGKPEENLADDPVTGKPRVFFSKGEKAAYLRERGIMECGDRVHGAPVNLSRNQTKTVDTKHEVKMALKMVKEMGRDRRRQEYLRIQKEGERYAKR